MKFWPKIHLNNNYVHLFTCIVVSKKLSKQLVGIKFCRFSEFHGFEDHIGSPTYLAMFPS